jgi:glycosyltransferase involved in cell wall biosynthesis
MLVSVVIPTFNCADFLVEAIRSILAQTYEDYEIIVVDDGSTDHTETALRQFATRIRYIRQEPGGPSVARNRGILEARGELVAFLDADDLWRPTKLARQVEYLNHHPEAVLVYTDFTRGPNPGSNNDSRLKAFKPRDPADPFHTLLEENFIATPSVVVRREALARSGLFDPTLKGSEDFDLWLRLAKAPGRPSGGFGFIDDILADVRQHSSNTSRGVELIQHQIRAARMMLERWGGDSLAARLLRRRLGTCCWNLAYAEQCRGDYAEARSAYWSSARHAWAGRPSDMSFFRNWKNPATTPSVVEAVARAAFMSLPKNVVRMVTQRPEAWHSKLNSHTTDPSAQRNSPH